MGSDDELRKILPFLVKQTSLLYQLWCVHVCLCVMEEGKENTTEIREVKELPCSSSCAQELVGLPVLSPQWKVTQHNHSEPQNY